MRRLLVLAVSAALLGPIGGAVAVPSATTSASPVAASATTGSANGSAVTAEAIAFGHTQYRFVKKKTCVTRKHKRVCKTRTVRRAIPAPSGRTARKLSGSTHDFAFLARDSKGRPAHWNRCAPIRYRVNPAHLPTSGLAEVRTAIAKLSAASGLTFVYAGSTSVVPYASGDWASTVPAGQDADLYIAWASASTVSYLSGSVAGVGGPLYVSDGSREPRITRAGLTLDTATKAPAGFGPGIKSGTLLLHELGHTVNLSHVGDAHEVMNGTVTTASRGEYQAGDLAGLKALAKYSCF